MDPDSPNGDISTDPKQILKVWQAYIEKLGRDSAAHLNPETASKVVHPHSYDDEFARRVIEEVRRDDFGSNKSVPELDRDITWQEVHACIVTLRNAAAPGPDGVVYELFKNAGLGLTVAITALFQWFWTNCIWPQSWQLGS